MAWISLTHPPTHPLNQPSPNNEWPKVLNLGNPPGGALSNSIVPQLSLSLVWCSLTPANCLGLINFEIANLSLPSMRLLRCTTFCPSGHKRKKCAQKHWTKRQLRSALYFSYPSSFTQIYQPNLRHFTCLDISCAQVVTLYYILPKRTKMGVLVVSGRRLNRLIGRIHSNQTFHKQAQSSSIRGTILQRTFYSQPQSDAYSQGTDGSNAPVTPPITPQLRQLFEKKKHFFLVL